MNKKLQKQIKAYAGLAGVLLAADKASGQVVYIDINPDTLSSPLNNDIKFDVNQDGQNDIKFSWQSAGGPTGSSAVFQVTYANVIGMGSNQVLKDSFPACAYAPPSFIPPNAFSLNQGDSIPSASQLNNFTQEVILENRVHIVYNSTNIYNCFQAFAPLNQDVCFGFKFKINGQFHYGWFKVEMQNLQFLIKEYAYQLQPNIPMLACDTTNLATGFSEHNQQQFNFSQQNNSIRISTFQKLNHADISVYDLLGKEILKQLFEGNETTIILDKKGIYFVEVKSEKGIFRKKVFIY